MTKGQIISGKFGEILVRKKSDVDLQLGELLIAENKQFKMLLQVYDLIFGSQISQQNLELISGLNLEDNEDLGFMEPHLRNYTLARLKNLITIKEKDARSSKELPEFFSNVREVKEDDLKFLTKPPNPLLTGYLRSGSKKLDLPVYLNALDVFSHHVLITGTTGKGKSVLMKNLLWNAMDNNLGMLVLDPHDEYYGRNNVGLKDHKKKVVYYSTENVPTGQRTLKINLKHIRPDHFDFMNFSSPQRQLMYTYYKLYRQDWIKKIFVWDVDPEKKQEFHEMSLAVVRRQLKLLLDLEVHEKEIFCNGVFDLKAGETTVHDIATELENEHLVIIDTSNFSGHEELLIGSMITSEVFNRYRHYKLRGDLKEKPVISVVLEEAPRVLGKEILEKGSNIFSTLAREGRKFKVGLVAITQLPSLIPREILANINTKIILGTEMSNERQAIIESASQDLSDDSRSIASLDKGEAIISSNFTKFAIPIKIPFFDEEVKNLKKEKKTESKDSESQSKIEKPKKDFSGIKLE